MVEAAIVPGRAKPVPGIEPGGAVRGIVFLGERIQGSLKRCLLRGGHRRIAAQPFVAEQVGGLDAQFLEGEQGGKLRIEQARLHQINDVLIAHAKLERKRLGVFQFVQSGSLIGVAIELEPVCQWVGVGEQRVFGGRNAQVFGQNARAIVRVVVRVSEKLQRVGGFEHVQQLPQGRLEVAQEAPHGFDPEVKRQSQRISGAGEDGIRLGKNILRLRQQVGALGLARVVGSVRVQRAVDDVILEDFIDDIDIGQDGVGVLAGQGYVRQVGAARHQRIIGFQIGIGIIFLIVRVLPVG